MDSQTKQFVKQTASEVKNLTRKLGNLSTKNGGSSKSARKRARRRQRGGNSNGGLQMNTQTHKPTSIGNLVMSGASDTGLRRLRLTPRNNLSDPGISFLKCAFAPPDFQSTSVTGVPDDFRGMSLTRKHRFVGTGAFSSGTDYYYFLLPVPGVAYYVASVAAGTPLIAATTLTPVYYTDFASMFGTTASTADIVTKFRYVSNHIEVIPTVNQMTWSGSIQCWKLPITLIHRQSVTPTDGDWSVGGISGANTNLSNQYTGPFIMGLYSAAYNANGTFLFQPILESIANVPITVTSVDFGQILSTGGFGFPGLDNEFESLVVKFSGITATENAIIKTWACVEYQASPNNALYEFQSLSPSDPLSIELYRSIINGLPVGVPFEDNDSFWERVLRIVHQLTGVGSILPGPYGMASRGLNLLSGAGLSMLH
jgi:hypothetical protein